MEGAAGPETAPIGLEPVPIGLEPARARFGGCSGLTVDDVYELAKSIGAEVEKLIDGFGRESVAGLVPRTVEVLELLEGFAGRNQALRAQEEELLRALERLQPPPPPRSRRWPGDERDEPREEEQGEEKQEQWRTRCEELQLHVQQLEEQREELEIQLKGSHAHEGRLQQQEREVMLKLKQVVDKQRDELRAKEKKINSISTEVEALQEQLDRFMRMNAELRRRQEVLQAQLSSSVQRRADAEAELEEERKKSRRLQGAEPAAGSRVADGDADVPCFTKQEVREVLAERNELKANVFLLQEELNFYQREILNEERCPGFLLAAVGAAIRKQRMRIKAKMLGIPEQQGGSVEEQGGAQQTLKGDDGNDSVDSGSVDGGVKLEESRIRNLFGFLTWSGGSTNQSPAHPSSSAHMSSSASGWEIIDESESSGEAEPRGS